jgi:hypothetical protein
MDPPIYLRAARVVQTLGWDNFRPRLVVKGVALPLTLMLLEALVVGYFLTRSAASLMCETVPEDPAGYICAVGVLRRSPPGLILVATGWVCARACLVAVGRAISMRRTRVLLNRE